MGLLIVALACVAGGGVWFMLSAKGAPDWAIVGFVSTTFLGTLGVMLLAHLLDLQEPKRTKPTPR